MRSGKDLLNKPIYSIDEGKLLGKAQDLYLNDGLDAVLGVFIGSQGLIRRKSELIRSGEVVVFGLDAILVNSSKVITDDTTFPAARGWIRREKIVGREVDTPGGTRLGVVGDVIVDSAGAITGFSLSRVFVEGPLADKRLIDRSVLIDTGSDDNSMTVDLPRLEASLSGTIVLPVSEEQQAKETSAPDEPETLNLIIEEEPESSEAGEGLDDG
ncbi:MAG: PRC-barrel domain-containing protein [Chloroflexota bacterium]|jgi:uncharacterized protein YrrD